MSNMKRILTTALLIGAGTWVCGGMLKVGEEDTDRDGKKNLVVENDLIRVVVEPSYGARIRSLYLKAQQREEVYISADDTRFGGFLDDRMSRQMLKESPCQSRVLERSAERLRVESSYVPQKGDFARLEIRKVFTLKPDSATVHVEHQVVNRDEVERRIAPWFRNIVADYVKERRNAASHGADTSLVVEGGVFHRIASGRDSFAIPARNWVARVPKEPKPEQGIVYFVFDYDDVYQLYTVHFQHMHCVELVYRPVKLAPGASWETSYLVAAAGPLANVRFASGNLAADLKRTDDALVAELSPTASFGEVEVVLTPDKAQAVSRRCRLEQGCTTAVTFPASAAETYEMKVMRGGVDLLSASDGTGEKGPMVSDIKEIRAVDLPPEAPAAVTPWPRKAAAFASLQPRILPNREMLAEDQSLQVWAENGLERVFERDAPDPTTAKRVDKVSVAAARGERESFQIAIRNSGAQPLKDVRLSIGGWAGKPTALPSGIAQWNALAYIETRQPSHFRDYPVGRWPDPLDKSPVFKIEPGQSRVIWFSLQVPREAAAGRYKAPVELLVGERKAAGFEVELRVFGFALPHGPALAFDAGLFYGPVDKRLKRIGCARTVGEVQQDVADYIISRRMSPRGGYRSGRYTQKNADKFEAEIIRLKSLGVRLFPNGGVNLKDLGRMKGAEALLEKHGVLRDTYTYAFDEIHGEQYPQVIEWCKNWHSASRIPILVVCYGFAKELIGHFDIWAGAHIPPDMLDEVKASGTRLWSVNAGIGHIDSQMNWLPNRKWSWGNFLNGRTGNLAWSVISWNADPWVDPSASGANCEGLTLYPDPTGFTSSARFEICADAIDDYDYLVLLREGALAGKKGGGRPELVAEAERLLADREFVGSVKDTAAFLARRDRIGELIELLGRAATR